MSYPRNIRSLAMMSAGTMTSLQQEIDRKSWAAARLLAEELRGRLQQLEHQMWRQQKKEAGPT